MRAEAQAHIDQINAATALLRRFLDWDRALKRLDELNAKVEDPALWNDPKAAQDVMRERRRLEEAIGATRTLERELADTSELIELAESEGDDAMVDDAVRSLAELAERADRDKVAALLAGEADANSAYVEINAGAGRGGAATRRLANAERGPLAGQSTTLRLGRASSPVYRSFQCAPKRRPTSTRSMLQRHCCAAFSTGTGR